MKNWKTTLAGCICALSLTAQQDVQFTQVLSNPYLLNPGAAGMTNFAEFNLGTRMQWTGIEGRPTTSFISGHSQIRFKKNSEATPLLDGFAPDRKSVFDTPVRSIGKKHIAGGKVVTDRIGPFSRTSAMGTYAIHLPLTSKINIGLGMGVGFGSFAVDQSKVMLIQSDDATYLNYLSASNRMNMLDVQAGFVMYNDKFFIGFSGNQLMKNNVHFAGMETENVFERHWYAIGSYRLQLGEKYGLEPLVIFKNTVASPVSADFGLRFHYGRMGWLSLGYRGKAALTAGFGFNFLKQFRFSYSFDMGASAMRTYGNGTHEVHLGILLGHRTHSEKEKELQEKQRQIMESDELKIGTE